MGWFQQRKTRFSNRLSAPNPNEGSDGDIQVRRTKLGSKLFGKLGGRWLSTNLFSDNIFSMSDNTGRETIKLDPSVGLSVDQIKLTGKIEITSTGTDNVVIGTGNTDVGSANVVIGVNAGAAMTSGVNNVFIGWHAADILTGGNSNVCIGRGSAPHMTGTISNTIIGMSAGEVIETGSFNTYIGFRSAASGTNVSNEVVICGGQDITRTVGKGSDTVVLGASDVTDIYMSGDSGATVHSRVLALKETTTPSTLADHGKIWTTSANELFFKDGDGTVYNIDITAV
jgi:hypothetical protein